MEFHALRKSIAMNYHFINRHNDKTYTTCCTYFSLQKIARFVIASKRHIHTHTRLPFKSKLCNAKQIGILQVHEMSLVLQCIAIDNHLHFPFSPFIIRFMPSDPFFYSISCRTNNVELPHGMSLERV